MFKGLRWVLVDEKLFYLGSGSSRIVSFINGVNSGSNMQVSSFLVLRDKTQTRIVLRGTPLIPHYLNLLLNEPC